MGEENIKTPIIVPIITMNNIFFSSICRSFPIIATVNAPLAWSGLRKYKKRPKKLICSSRCFFTSFTILLSNLSKYFPNFGTCLSNSKFHKTKSVAATLTKTSMNIRENISSPATAPIGADASTLNGEKSSNDIIEKAPKNNCRFNRTYNPIKSRKTAAIGEKNFDICSIK